VSGIDSHWLHGDPARPGTGGLLVVLAHPDDETFGAGGTLARYAASGVPVHCACPTRGEAGTIEPRFLDGYADAAELRTSELLCAARALGVESVHILGYRDSGMPGAAENQHAASLEQAPLDEVVARLVEVMQRLRPRVVVTHNAHGGYGHPDHIKTHRATIAAYPQGGATKLYYDTFPLRFLRVLVAMMRLLRRDPRRAGTNNDVDLLQAIAEATPVTTSIDVSRVLALRDTAWRCHASQLSGPPAGMLRLPLTIRRVAMRYEHFTRVDPPWPSGARREHDLFAGSS
jgi:LmbE family N-acetylglucosaminyl deacetylase